MFGEINTTLRLLAVVLIVLGALGNLGMAVWYIWQKGDSKRGVLHVVLAIVVLLGLTTVLF
jgi:hypothetical protein